MVTRLTNYTKQFWILLSTDDMDTPGSHNGDEAIVIDRDERYVFDEENRIWRQIPMSGGGGGGVTVTSLTVTENGTYTAPSGTAYSPVTVNVAGSGEYTLDDILQKKEPSGHVTINGYTPEVGTLNFNKHITAVTLQNVVVVGTFEYMFRNDTGLVTAVFTNVSGSPLENAFYGCNNLSAFDGDVEKIGKLEFYGCANMTTFVLRRPSVTQLLQTNCFQNTPFDSGKSGGTLYVPSALISNYQSATNWSTVLGYPNNQIKAIEGSIYETQYADGTPIA